MALNGTAGVQASGKEPPSYTAQLPTPTGRSMQQGAVEQLRHALIEFREVYNTTWLIERHGFRPPAAIRAEHLSPAAKAA